MKDKFMSLNVIIQKLTIRILFDLFTHMISQNLNNGKKKYNQIMKIII